MAVSIEAIRLKHADAVQELASDPEIGRTTNVPFPYPEGGALSFITDAAQKRAMGTQFSFAIIGDGAVVGVCSLVGVGGAPRSAQFGYWVGRPYWGRGFATSAGRQVLEYGFSALGLASVRATCLPGNGASRRVLEKLGFRRTHEGPAPGTSKWPPTQMVEHWELLRSEGAS